MEKLRVTSSESRGGRNAHEPSSSLLETRYSRLPCWLAIHLPDLPLEIHGRGLPPSVPLAVTHYRQGPRVFLCNQAAAGQGIRSGLRVAAARALLSRLRMVPRAPAEERLALERVGAWAGQFTSQVSLEPEQGLLLEIGGSLRLFGGEDPLIQRVRSGLEALGYRAFLALAPTPGGAMLLARAGQESRAAGLDELRAAISRLSLSVLWLDEQGRAALGGMGLTSIGDLLRLPREGLARRLGAPFMRRLRQVLGEEPDPRPVFRAPAQFGARLELPAEATEVGALLFAARRLVMELTGFLVGREAGAQRLDWHLRHPEGRVTRFQVGLLHPTSDAGRLLTLLKERLERLELAGPVREIGLRVRDIRPLSFESLTLFPGRLVAGAGKGNDLLERLEARLGRQAVTGIRLAPEHRPERAWRYCSPGETGAGTGLKRRPLWLLPEPRLLEIEDGRPRWHGPVVLERERERIESGWWDGEGLARDYFIARTTEGGRLWVFREAGGRRRWFLHGLFG